MYEVTIRFTPNEEDPSPVNWDWRTMLDLVEPVEVVSVKQIVTMGPAAEQATTIE